MSSAWTNNIRLEEIATGDQSGSWGQTTNSNLDAIASSLGYGAKSFAADSDETFTMANVPTQDTLRSLYLKMTSAGSLTATRTATLAPASVSKVWIVENATTGGQSITIKQGSAGTTVTVLTGQTKILYSDGGGSSLGNIVEVTSDMAISDLFVDDDLNLQSDGGAINFGADAEIQMTHVADTGLLLTETGGGVPTLQFRDAGLSVSSSVDGQLDIAADTELQIVAPTLDINSSSTVTVDTATLALTGNMDVTGNITVTGTVDGRDVSTDGTKLDGIEAGADVTDATNVVAAGAALRAGTTFTGAVTLDGATALQLRDAALSVSSSADGQLDIAADTELQIVAPTVDINAGTAMTVDTTTFTVTGNTAADGDVTLTGASYNAVWDKSDNALEFADNAKVTFGADSDLQIYHDGSHSIIQDTGTGDLRLYGNNVKIKNADNTAAYFQGINGAEVNLYHNNALKLATTSTGVDITGTATMDGLTVDGDATLTEAADRCILKVQGKASTDTQDYAGVGAELQLISDITASNQRSSQLTFGDTTTARAAAIRTYFGGVNGSIMRFYVDGDSHSADVNVSMGQDSSNRHFTIFHDVATPSTLNAGLSIETDSNGIPQIISSAGSTSSSRTHAEFMNTNGTVGSITTSGSATAFNTSSDYRLKQDVSYEWAATEKLLQLQPVTYAFKADPDTTVEGFLAHELQEHSPNAVTGEKDGDTMQSVDHSKLVPLLVKTIQELEARITELENARG
jgi:hypothetical protein|tara:strand:+ start:557 stop:2788 length:2232 start_codon:yes stop_codon:yes gene_type:complete